MRQRHTWGRASHLRFLAVLCLALLLASQAAARIPGQINYQGKLADSEGQPMSGPHTVVFSVYDAATGGTLLWSEVRGVTPDSAGVFSIILGAIQPIEIQFTNDAWLQVQIDGAVLTPRRQMVSVPYAFNAGNVNGIAASATPAPGALYPLDPEAKFPAAVLPEKLPPTAHAPTHAAGGTDEIAVTGGLVVDGTITAADLAANSVTVDKIVPDVLSSLEGVANDGGGIDLVPGSNVAISADANAKTITISAAGLGDITEVDAGAGLAGGGTSGAVTLELAVPLDLADSSAAGVISGTNLGAGPGLDGNGTAVGVSGTSAAGKGVVGTSTTGTGVFGETSQDDPNIGASVVGRKLSNGNAIMGLKDGNAGHAVYGSNIGITGCGVAGWSREYVGTWGESYHDNGLCGVTDRPDNNYGIYTPDNIWALNYQTMGALMQVVQNAGSEPLEPGEVVSFAGIADPLGADSQPVVQVAKAAEPAGTAVAGVVYSRFNIEAVTGRRQSDGKDSVSATEVTPAGSVEPGDYLLLVTHGPARVKASALASPIRIGDPLLAAGQAGFASSTSTLRPGSLLGKALEPLSSGEGKIYVFVTLQ